MALLQAQSTISKHSPIVVFDSGVGGLSVLKHLLLALPAERFIYLADTAWVPYGDKPTQQVIERTLAMGCLAFRDYQAKALVIACNTATAAAIELLREQYPHNIIIGVEPALKPAISLTCSGVVGVLATANTLASDKFQRLVHQFGERFQVLVQPCFGLVEQIEAGDLQSACLQQLLKEYVEKLIKCGADVLVLGCTHYPFVAPLIRRFAGDHVYILESGAAVAKETKRRIMLKNLHNAQPLQGQFETTLVQAFSSGDAESLRQAFERLLDMQGVACLKEQRMLK